MTYDEGITLLNQDDARVCRQSVLQGTSLPLGSKISLHLTLDRELVAKAAAEADRQADDILKQQAIADSLARRTADSLKMLNSNQPQPEQADDEFFF